MNDFEGGITDRHEAGQACRDMISRIHDRFTTAANEVNNSKSAERRKTKSMKNVKNKLTGRIERLSNEDAHALVTSRSIGGRSKKQPSYHFVSKGALRHQENLIRKGRPFLR